MISAALVLLLMLMLFLMVMLLLLLMLLLVMMVMLLLLLVITLMLLLMTMLMLLLTLVLMAPLLVPGCFRCVGLVCAASDGAPVVRHGGAAERWRRPAQAEDREGSEGFLARAGAFRSTNHTSSIVPVPSYLFHRTFSLVPFPSNLLHRTSFIQPIRLILLVSSYLWPVGCASHSVSVG